MHGGTIYGIFTQGGLVGNG